jgi:hypothetical protein
MLITEIFDRQYNLKTGNKTTRKIDGIVRSVDERRDIESHSKELCESQHSIITDPKFVQWFANSVCVDNAGKPLVVYHGTESDFENYNSWPIYFTPDKEVASEYALNKNWAPYEKSVPNVRPAYLRILKPRILDDRALSALIDDENGDRDWTILDNYCAKLERTGYDGVYLRDVRDYAGGGMNNTIRRKYDQWIVFSNDQVWPAYGKR